MGSSCCITGETIVYTKNFGIFQPVQIKDIQINDMILSKDGTYEKVVDKIIKQRRDIKILRIDNDILNITPDHPFWVKDKFYNISGKAYISECTPITQDIMDLNIITIRDYFEDGFTDDTVYNIKTDGPTCTYIANGILLHNGGGSCSGGMGMIDVKIPPDYIGMANTALQKGVNNFKQSGDISSKAINDFYNNISKGDTGYGLQLMGLKDKKSVMDKVMSDQGPYSSYVQGSYNAADDTMELVSDENAKDIQSNVNAIYIPINDQVLANIADLKSYYYKYKDNLQQYTDDNLHYGPMAQDLLQIPFLSDFVVDDGFLKLENLDQMALFEVKLLQFIKEKVAALTNVIEGPIPGTYSDKGDAIIEEEDLQ